MPLTGLKVLDLSTLLPGPYATMMLADMGAEVLRVEAPGRPELTRQLPPFDEHGVTYSHSYLNRSKSSIGLNLKNPGAVEIVKQLVQQYDIVVEQFRPGVMDRLGIGYETLKTINPRLIYCAITGYGQTGPYKNRPGHDINYLATSGSASYTGRAGEGPLPLGIQLADIAGGSLHAVTGILAAVIERQRSNKGQMVDISMTDASFALNGMTGAVALGTGISPGRGEDMLNGGSFYDYYKTSDGRYFSVGSLEPQFMKLLCDAVGRPELSKLGLSQKTQDQRFLREELTRIFASKAFSEWRDVFKDIDACVEPVLTVIEAMEHPQLRERDMVVEVSTPNGSVLRQIGCPIKFSRNRPRYKHAGGSLGADSQQVLQELGFSGDEIEEMKKSGALG
ncbi:CaiB/BaiF CoA-transferase family protein [Alcanivorax sp. 1008]|uniref:CaiB/BaiF CoA transferase family protein n=1 Tax=Alcanivorax sp. 1008 TaxID=2816853 RepID=UPI001DC7DC1D|nr:CaiB/BaiF CoA-transferase family protein [Alcanivorax sp. 1008]MCC1495939.1 CoA transferase [Alcanivorax sp. 1008]